MIARLNFFNKKTICAGKIRIVTENEPIQAANMPVLILRVAESDVLCKFSTKQSNVYINRAIRGEHTTTTK